MYFFFHPIIDPLIFLAFGLSIWAQYRVKSTFSKWSKVGIRSGMTGYEAARTLLDRNGLHEVSIERVSGTLSDHYDEFKRVVRFSDLVYTGRSVAYVSVACHEVGHAIQHKVSNTMLVLRHRMFPVVRFAAGIAPFLLIAGILS